jgi:hypothetical protein
MATTTLPGRESAGQPVGNRYDRYFFSGMALLILGTVLLGFAKSYFLAGMVRTRLPNLLIHVHAVLFVSWIGLLVVQASLVAADRVDVHRRLGVAGFVLAGLMVVVGVMAGTDLLRRSGSYPGSDAKTFYAFTLGDLLIFGILIGCAYRARSRPADHKRLILIGTISLMDAAIGRWPFAFINMLTLSTALINYSFLALIVIYDLWANRKLSRVTIWASTFVIVLQQLRIPVGKTHLWHSFAAWAEGIARRMS